MDKDFEEFLEKFKTTEEFEKAYPVGKKILWTDRDKWTIVGYIEDKLFTNKDYFEHLVIIKKWLKHRRYWTYQTHSIYLLYFVDKLMKKEK